MGTITRIIIGLVVGVGGGILINKSTEAGGFEWIKHHLRVTWVIYLILLSGLLFSDSNILGIAMNLHEKWNKIGYLVCFVFGGLLLCGYWYFAGTISKSAEKKSEQSVQIEQPKQPTAKEIAGEVVRELGKTHQNELINQFPEGFVVFGLMKPGEPLIPGFVPDGVKVDWNTGGVETVTDQNVTVMLPNMNFRGNIFNQCSVTLFRQKNFLVKAFRTKDLGFQVKMLHTTQPVIIVLGVVKEKEK